MILEFLTSPNPYKEAAYNYKLAAEQGNIDSAVNLGYLYQNGFGVEQSDEMALLYFKKAAEGGSSFALGLLAECYELGRGVSPSNEEALRYYILCAKSLNLKKIESIESTANSLNTVNQAEVKFRLLHEAFLYHKANAYCGNLNELVLLGRCYKIGRGISESEQLGDKYLKMASDRGSSNAQNWLGWYYDYSSPSNSNYKDAAHYYKLAAEQGDSNSQVILGYFYQYGLGVAQSNEEAFSYYKKAASENAFAMGLLAECYENGIGTEKSDEQALYYYNLCANEIKKKDLVKLLKSNCDSVEGSIRVNWYEKSFRKLQEVFLYIKAQAMAGNQKAMQKLEAFYDRELSKYPIHNHLLAAVFKNPVAVQRLEDIKSKCIEIYYKIKN